MSVVGFDLGNENCVVAVARQRGIDVVLNDESNRETPAIVSFGDKQRFLGTAGAASAMMNPKNTISQIKRLLGRKFKDPVLQKDIQSVPFSVTEGPDGYPLINARYLGEQRSFTPTQLLAMVLSNLKSIAESNLNSPVIDCCIGIPVYFTDFQRRAVLDAAAIAGLRPLGLIHESTATALGYGIYKTDLPENDTVNVAFVDVGHSSLQVSIVGFKKGELKVLAHSFDHSLGGRDFDEALFGHFAGKFKEEYKIDVYKNARACLRLRAACEKVKKMLSANPEVPLNIECLMDDKDVRGFMKREEFEKICVPILERVKGPLEKALSDSGLGLESIHAVEVIGSGSRVPAIIRILHEFFGKEPRRTMNASECVARGCALQCAILSPTFKVRHFEVRESFPFSIALSWKATTQNPETGATENQQSSLVFPKGNPIPSAKALTFFRSSTFTVDVVYTDLGESQAYATISTYTIGPFQTSGGQRAKLKVKVRLNIHGIVSIESATILEEDGAEVALESARMDTDEPSKKDMDAKPSAEDSTEEAENGEKNVQMETDTKGARKRRSKIIVPVSETIFGGLPPNDLQKVIEKEFEMALQDRVMEETKDKKNAVEAYVYDMRNKLHDKYHDFVMANEMEEFIAKLQSVEDWLYEEGEDETKGVYVAKLEELKKQGDPIEERYKESLERGPIINQFVYCINSYREAALSKDPKFDHIDPADKQKVISECSKAEAWLREKKQQQDALPKHAMPVLYSAEMKKKAEVLDRFCRPIMTKPKPAPPKPQTPPPTSPETVPQTPDEEIAEVDSHQYAPEAMDTDKP
ncbi:heat shock 70 kDa protein 15-like [Wolffia australiana]